MSFDGLFTKHLVEEMKPKLMNNRINKIINISDSEIVFSMQSKDKVLFSLNPQNPHFRITHLDYLNSNTLLSNFLKRKIEGGIISNFYQIGNDRVVVTEISNTDDLGYKKSYNLICEFIGRNANMIITDSDFMILEAIKKSYLSDDRIIQPKVKYEFLSQNKVNPFLNDNTNFQNNIFEGVGPLLFKEINFNNSLINTINQKTKPTIFTSLKRQEYYAFDLNHIEGDRIYFNTLSEMLEYYYVTIQNDELQNADQKRINQFISKELSKLHNKLSKQKTELLDAHANLKYEQLANLLTTNIHKVSKYQEEIKVFNFYTNEDIIIKLNPKIKPTENINMYFNKFKKAKRTIEHLNNTIEETKREILYYETLKSQSTSTNINDLKEIISEVGLSNEKSKPKKPQILRYTDDKENIYLVGKNNKQNEYISFTLADKFDYFFHVLNYPGSHVCFKGNITEDTIYNAALLGAYYSKANTNVNVDYTQYKWVKKIKGMKGSFVRYTNHSSINVPCSLDEINKRLTQIK
ncbi:MAG: NFACT family protein [Bacilli bacterium]